MVLTIPGGARIIVEVLGFQGQQVRLGVEAPASVSIKRGEVAEPGYYCGNSECRKPIKSGCYCSTACANADG